MPAANNIPKPPWQKGLGFTPAPKGPTGGSVPWLAYPTDRNSHFNPRPPPSRPTSTSNVSTSPPQAKKQRKGGGGKGGGKPLGNFITKMVEKYHGKQRCDVLKGCSGDTSIIQLGLESCEKKSETSTKCRSQCTICKQKFNNSDATVQEHLKSTKHQGMEMLSGEVEVMGQHLAFGGQQHREAVCDSYMLAYFIQKERLPHTTAEKMKEVLKHLHFTNAEEVERVAMSSSTIARCPFTISFLQRGNIICMCVCVCVFVQKICTCVCVCKCVRACTCTCLVPPPRST